MSRTFRSLALAASTAAVVAAAPGTTSAATAPGGTSIKALPGGGFQVCAWWGGWNSCATVSWASGLTAGAAAGGNGTSASAGAGVGSSGASASADASAWGNGAGAFAGIAPAYARIVKSDATSAIVIWGAPTSGPTATGYYVVTSNGRKMFTKNRFLPLTGLRPGTNYKALIMPTDGTDIGKPIEVVFATPAA